jgi:hypothetical protein
MDAATLKPQKASTGAPVTRRALRIATALGEVRLNFQKVTHGLAHGAVAPGSAKNTQDTVWSDAKASVGGANGLSQGNSNAGSSGSTAGSSTAATTSPAASTVTASASQSGDGNGNGANGNGKSNNGNGNGNGGVGNGNGKGNAKH